MDPIVPKQPANPAAENPHPDPSFQVMPQVGGVPVPPQAHSEPMAAAPAPHPSGSRSKLVYVILIIVALLVIAALAYFLLGRDSNKSEPAASKLPKTWMTQYFGSETCTDQTRCGDDADPDADGLSNYDEFRSGTAPTSNDTDGDGLADGDEVNIYNLDPTLKNTDRRDIVESSGWTDGSQIQNGYDPITPGLKLTDSRIQQIQQDIQQYGLHAPTTTTLGSTGVPSNTQEVPASPTPTSADQPQADTTLPEVPHPTTHQVTIQDMAYSQARLLINKGDTVTWTNQDPMANTVTADSEAGPDSPQLATGESYSYTFDTAGTFNYHCTIHPSMKAAIIVQ